MLHAAALKSNGLRLDAAAPEASAWVAANAGSGKTHLLVSRVLRLLLAGVAPSRILCVTYTRAAAAEMRGRILSSLSRWVALDDAALRDALLKLNGAEPNAEMLSRARSLFAVLADAPQGVRIDTLHAFCQSLLKCFPLEAGVAPYFSVIDDRTARELLHEAAMELFEESVRGANRHLSEAVRALAARMSEGSFHELLLGIAGERRRLKAMLANGREAAVARMYRFLRVSPQETEASLLAEWLPGLETPLEELLALHLTKLGTPRKGVKDAAVLALQERVHGFYLRRCALRNARMSAHLITLAGALIARYDALKAARAVSDYDDLVEAATALLSQQGAHAWVMYKLDGGIDHVLIDEAQDTSREQWEIARALTEEFFAGEGRSEAARTLFVVGDEKQSIFRFQGAAPELFARMRAYFAKRIPAAGLAWADVTLPESFRSAAPVLQAVDAVFGTQHVLTREGAPGVVEVWPLVAAEKEDRAWQVPRVYVKRHDAAQMLAQQLAETIGGWLARGEAAPGDIMILVRRRGALAGAIMQALKRANVPVAGADRLKLSGHLAVQDLLALGAFLLLPEDDLSLAALLKSPLFCFSEDALFALAHGREGSLWARLSGEAREKLSGWLALADFMPPYELFAHVLDAGDGRARFASRMGAAAHDVLDEFLAQALLYENAHTPTLQGFLHWMTMAEVEIKRDMEQGGAAVRIMTVHAAKGLQAKIVILPDTSALKVRSGPLLWSEEGGLLWNAGEKDASEELSATKAAHAAAEAAEYKRLLYVAMTRAEDRLYICGIAPKRGEGKGSWHALAWDALEPVAQKVGTPAGPGLRLASMQQEAVKGAAPQYIVATSPMPEALTRHALPEDILRPLSPSRLGEEDVPALSPVTQQNTYRRGTLLHRLLQYLPAAADRGKAAALLLARWGVAEAEAAELSREALALLNHPEFAVFFGPDSLAEVPLSGSVEWRGKKTLFTGQVDRLAVSPREVWALDYKTHAVPPAVAPLRYLRQMAAYRALLAGIYPDKRIRCALLWTAGPKLVELTEA